MLKSIRRLLSLLIVASASILFVNQSQAATINLCTQPGIDPTGLTDSRNGVQAALNQTSSTGSTLTVACPVKIVTGYDSTKPIFIDSNTKVLFSGNGKFIVDNILVPAFLILGSSNITFVNSVFEYVGAFGDIAIDVHSGPAAGAPSRVNDITEKNWYIAHRGIKFDTGINPNWVGPTNGSAIIMIKGSATNINFLGGKEFVPANANAAYFAPTVFSFGTDWNNNSVATGTMDSTNSSIPSKITVANFSLDGYYMGFVGSVKNSKFTGTQGYRYSDLQSSTGTNQGGVSTWFAPPHLFYLVGSPSLVIEDSIDNGQYVGSVIRRPFGSGSLLSLKVEVNNNLIVNHYTSYRPDGVADFLVKGNPGGSTLTNITGSFDSSIQGLDTGHNWGVRFPGNVGGYSNLTINTMKITDTATAPNGFPIGGIWAGAVNSNIVFKNVHVFQNVKVSTYLPGYPGTNNTIDMTVTYKSCVGGPPKPGANNPAIVFGC